jgi:SAM-dependent methyltransferase
MAARSIGAKRLASALVAVLVCLMLSSSTLYSVSENDQMGAIGLSDKGLEKKPKLDVPYESTTYEIAEEMLRMADVRKNDLVYDLGCGDGRIVIMAVKERGARGVGVDLDPERIKESKENARQAGVTGRVHFFQQDLFKTDIKKATVVMLYLWPEVNLRLRPRLFTELRPGTRVVSHSHTMGDWKPDKTSEVSNHQLYFWVIPANLTGTWTWSMSTGKGSTTRLAVLRINQQFQEVKGSLTIDNADIPFASATLTGNKVRLVAESEVDGQKVTMKFQGRVLGDAIRGSLVLSGGSVQGNVPWEAKRDPSTRVSLDK